MGDTYPTINGRFRTKTFPGVLAYAVALLFLACSVPTAYGQTEEEKETRVTTIRGRVLNQGTKEPLGRALVITSGDVYATMTDDRGQFELKIVEQRPKAPGEGNVAGGRAIMQFGVRVSLQARKPGYLLPKPSRARIVKEGLQEATIYLVPEGLIVGRVTGAEAGGMQCQLYSLSPKDATSWEPGQTFTLWANGEFRFSGLPAGNYRLITHELPDRDSLGLGPGAQMYGYPPVYYPNTTDFSSATPIVVKAGETTQVNLTVARREYYPVRIPIANPPATPAIRVSVYPRGHWGPGWSLGYNSREQMIEGALPNGNYTLELETFEEHSSTGIVNFTVGGQEARGPAVNLVPDATVSVNLREEFRARQGEFLQTNDQQDLQKAQVFLRPLDDSFGKRNVANAQPVEGTKGQNLTLRNVRPGAYRVEVNAFGGYAAVVESGGVDLLRQPLVVGMGGAVPPIEITLRDDGAEVSGVIEGSPAAQGNPQDSGASWRHERTISLVPFEPRRPQRINYRTLDGSFYMHSLAPGDYLVVAYDDEQGSYNPDLGDEGFLEKAQKFHVEAGDKLTNLRIKMIQEEKDE